MRIADGLDKGATLTFCTQNPFGDPRVYSVNSTRISLRKEDAEAILIEDYSRRLKLAAIIRHFFSLLAELNPTEEA